MKNTRVHLVCMGCKHRKINLKCGILCGLTGESPDFVYTCTDFEFLDTANSYTTIKKKGWLKHLFQSLS